MCVCGPLLYSKHLEKKEHLLKFEKVRSQKGPEDNFFAQMEVGYNRNYQIAGYLYIFLYPSESLK